MKILCAVDGSAFTKKAVDFLSAKFDWFKDTPELHIVHVHAAIPGGRARAVAGAANVENYYKEESDAILHPLEEALRQKNIPVKTSYLVGDAAEQIEHYAKQNGMDMIVMGSHGHGALKNLLMGSVATKVVAQATVPVLLIR
jgi:nucleotide-binding universal stress UspA family protein